MHHPPVVLETLTLMVPLMMPLRALMLLVLALRADSTVLPLPV